VLEELGIGRAHVMGLSQGGLIAQAIAMQYPDRVITCVSASTVFDTSGAELAMFSSGAEAFYEQMKAAKIFDESGATPWNHATVTKREYMTWKMAYLAILLPGFPEEVYEEIAEKEFLAGIVTPEQGAICGLAWELWVRLGKLERHHDQLRDNNAVPILFTHGRQDPVIHFGEVERLFKITGNCVLEVHEFGHNFGPPHEQEKLLSRYISFMKRFARAEPSSASRGSVQEAPSIGRDAFDSQVTVDVAALTSMPVPQVYEEFCSVQTAADTHAVFDVLLDKLELGHLNGRGLQLFVALKEALGKSGLNYKQGKLLRDLNSTLLKAQTVVGKIRHDGKLAPADVLRESVALAGQDGSGRFNKVVVGGAGPVGLRTACELQLLGFDVLVVEKRPNFSRANILTFWDETMADMLALGAKSYFPDLQPAGMNKHLGTRQIQVCLLKSLLLLGGRALYGREVCGLQPGSTRWQAFVRPSARNRKVQTDSERAIEFQRTFDDDQDVNGLQANQVDQIFVSGGGTRGSAEAFEFDAYMIAEGGWSDSTKRLGFSKSIQRFKSIFGVVINAQYNKQNIKERNMQSQIHFALSGKWPLRRCPIQAEFLEYLKGETHFFALVVPKRNVTDRTEQYLERMEREHGESRAALPQSVIDMMRLASTQKGLLEMGVFKQDLGTGQQCLVKENVDVVKLHALARAVMSEMGLPENVEFCESNPVQLFDFSRRGRCVESVRVLCSDGPVVLDPSTFRDSGAGAGSGPRALAFPVGDALEEPNWTQGLGINRGFHSGMNQAFACLLAREESLASGVEESCAAQKRMIEIKWGQGHSGLAGSGSGNIGLKPFKSWNTDPRSRLPFK